MLPSRIRRNFRIRISQGDHCSRFLNSIFAMRNHAQVFQFPWVDRNSIIVLRVQRTWVQTTAWFYRGLRIASCLLHSWIASSRLYQRIRLWEKIQYYEKSNHKKLGVKRRVYQLSNLIIWALAWRNPEKVWEFYQRED